MQALLNDVFSVTCSLFWMRSVISKAFRGVRFNYTPPPCKTRLVELYGKSELPEDCTKNLEVRLAAAHDVTATTSTDVSHNQQLSHVGPPRGRHPRG